VQQDVAQQPHREDAVVGAGGEVDTERCRFAAVVRGGVGFGALATRARCSS
jgi:hypothetical protein